MPAVDASNAVPHQGGTYVDVALTRLYQSRIPDIALSGRICSYCSPGGDLKCTCGFIWICDACVGQDQTVLSQCPRCQRAMCTYSCGARSRCASCTLPALCRDCMEGECPVDERTRSEGVILVGTCYSCAGGRLCTSCATQDAKCLECSRFVCAQCVANGRCEDCGGVGCAEHDMYISMLGVCKACYIANL